MSEPQEPEFAALDPWCLVGLDDDRRILFGYAFSHPVTHGMAWTITSELRKLDRSNKMAATASGRSYRLGREFEALDVRMEGVEAGLAFEMLLENEIKLIYALRLIDKAWLTACKAARHLGLPIPPHTAAGVQSFLDENLERYQMIRRRRNGGTRLVH